MAAVVASASALESGAKMAPNGAGNGDLPKSEAERPHPSEKRKEKSAKRGGGGGGGRFEPYANPSKRYRAFITNIPFDVKWQYLKDLVKEKAPEHLW